VPHQLDGSFDAIDPGQADIHQHQCGIGLLAHAERSRSVIGFSDHAKLRVTRKNGAYPVPDYLMVVNYYNVERH
jgi:hypothetical protein